MNASLTSADTDQLTEVGGAKMTSWTVKELFESDKIPY